MIVVITQNGFLTADLKTVLTEHGLAHQILKVGNRASFAALYQEDILAAVVDCQVSYLPDHAWIDLLTSLGRRIPVIVIGGDGRDSSIGLANPQAPRQSEMLTWLKEPNAKEILTILDACGAIGIDHRKLERASIPLYNPQVPLHMLQSSGALSVLLVDASSFRKIAIEYGSEAYHKVQACFAQLLFELWGSSGSFRAADILCRRSANSNMYYIFLEQSRSASAVPAPGILERLADRLVVRLQNAFWREIFLDRQRRIIPDCIMVVPEIAIGFGTSIHNPCVDSLESVEQLLETAVEESRVQLKRSRDRQRELMQALIHTPGLLHPHYQAVFSLGSLTKQNVDAARSCKSLKPLEHLLFGFESLIRVSADAIDAIFDKNGPAHMDSRFMRPDVLFALAHAAKVGLELDQACLHHAVVNSGELPGTLLLNILPRNLYNIDKIKHLIRDRQEIMFEVSESEAINNFELMLRVRANLEKMQMRIATDDFGKGYSGLEQIIKIKPDLIKLDRSLIQDIHLDKPKEAFVNGLVRAAQIAGSAVLAEGVEKWEEAVLLQAMGIDFIQGFLLHRPQAATEIVKDLQEMIVLATVA